MRLHGGLDPRLCLDLARRAEASGLASVWFAENPFGRGVLPAASAVAALTREIAIGIGVFNPYNRHPTLMAMEIGALDALAQGRAALGVGSGIGVAVERMGLSYERPLGALRDTFQILRGMLRGEEVSHEGRVFSAVRARLDYAPPRPDMPIYMAAKGEQALRLCGEIADGLMVSNMCPPGFTARAVSLVRDGAAAAGRAIPAHVVQYVPCVARPDRAEARRGVKGTIAGMMSSYWELWRRFPAAQEAMCRDSGIPGPEFLAVLERLRAGEPAHEVLDDRFVDAFAVAGTAEDCLAMAATYARAGVTELAVTFVGAQPAADIAYLGAALTGTGAA